VPSDLASSTSPRRRRLAAALAALLTALASAAQEPAAEALRLSLDEAIVMALENNLALAVERLTPTIRQTAEDEAKAVFDPVVTADATARRERLERRGADGRFRHVDQDSLAVSGALSRHLPTGTTLTAGAEATVNDASSGGQESAGGLYVGATQALLRGRSVAANLARIREARLLTAQSEHEVRAVIEAIAADVEDTYWDLALAERRIAIVTESLKVAEQYLRETRERIAAGTAAEIELYAAEAEIPLRRQGLISANGAMKISRLRLLRLINPAGDAFWDRTLDLTDQPQAPAMDPDPVADHVALALARRPDLAQARLQIDLQDVELVRTRDGLLPRLDAFINLGKTGYARAFPQALWNLGTHDTYAVTAGLTYEYALGNREARASQRRAVLGQQQAEAALANLAQLIELDVRTAYVSVASTHEQVAASAATCRLRQETLRAETEKSRVGKSTSFLVAQAQRDLLASQIVEVEAVVNLLHALTTLYRLESSLLERRGIALGDLPQD